VLRWCSLGSGSTGNATLVKAGQPQSPSYLLIDCGLGLRDLERALLEAGVEPNQLDAIFITHEHADHVGSAASFSTRHGVPVWASHGTSAAAQLHLLGDRLHITGDGDVLDFDGLAVHPFTVPHDAREPLQLKCTDGNEWLGVLTDLGHVTPHVVGQLLGCEALLLEANHDVDLLRASRYPPFLQDRIAGTLGHLSNEQSALALTQLLHPKLRLVVAAHLSQQNNRPELALKALGDVLHQAKGAGEVADVELRVAHPRGVCSEAW
jgi:phosphoribosyl 1,2-cyclic phosphodiesterase